MKYVIIGAGAAGVSAVKEIIKRRSENDTITVITEETYPFYYRPRLIEYLSGEVSTNEIIINDEKWFESNKIDLKLAEKVKKIDFVNKKVISDNKSYQYDKLLLANGAHSYLPPIKGANMERVFTLRDLSDAKDIFSTAKDSKYAVVVGGGLLGIEAASNLKKAGLDVSIVERSEWCLSRQLDKEGGKLLIDILKKEKGLKFALDAATKELIGDDEVKGVLLEDGTEIKADLVLLSTGVRSNIDIFEGTDLEIKRAVDVNQYMETNIKDVYAAGDIAEYDGKFYGIWLPSVKMGQTAGKNMSGEKSVFEGVISSHTLKVAGINVVSAGNINPDQKYKFEIIKNKNRYKKVIRDQNRKAIGLIIVGDFPDQKEILGEIKRH